MCKLVQEHDHHFQDIDDKIQARHDRENLDKIFAAKIYPINVNEAIGLQVPEVVLQEKRELSEIVVLESVFAHLKENWRKKTLPRKAWALICI